MVLDTLDLAMEAGLHYLDPGAPGYRRLKRGRGFSYVDSTGKTLDGPDRQWIDSLAIPPAWREVWVSKDRRGHILATGLDNAGRKQYVYHPEWERVRDEVKFDRLGSFGERLPRLRKRVDEDLRGRGMSRARVVALAVAVMDRTLIRVGNQRYADQNESYGLTTLTCDHIAVDGGHVHLEFAGKGGSDRQVVFSDRRLSSLVAQCQEMAGQTLFSFETEGGELSSITSTDVNRYLSSVMNDHFTAKDFRTWGASSLVCAELAAHVGTGKELLRDAIVTAAERLGNTPSVCRSSYLHPAVIAAFEDGSLPHLWRRARPGRWIDRSESALRMVLDEAS